MNLADRLKMARETMAFGQKEFAEKLQISFRSWQDYELGKSVPGGKVFEALARLGLNTNWLLTGEGPKYRKDVCREADPVWTGKVNDAAGMADLGGMLGRFVEEYSLVPRYDVEVSAGHGSFLENDEKPYESMAFRKQWVKRMGLIVDKLAVVTARGDSMEPTVADGDVLLVDLSQRGIIDGAIHVLRNNGDVLVKRLQRGFGDQVIVSSDNKTYRELETTVDVLNVVGRVVWRGGRM